MLLELKHIYKNYLQDKIVIPVLKDVNISIDEGEYVAITMLVTLVFTEILLSLKLGKTENLLLYSKKKKFLLRTK